MKKNEREIASLAMRFMIGNRKQKSFRCKHKWEMYPLRMLVQGLAYNVRKKLHDHRLWSPFGGRPVNIPKERITRRTSIKQKGQETNTVPGK